MLQPAVNQKHFPDHICVGSDKSPERNFSTPSSDVLSQGNQFVLRSYSI